MRRLCAEGSAARNAGHPRPAALPLLRGHSVRRRMVSRAHEPLGTEGQRRGTLRSGRLGGGRTGDPAHGRRGPAGIARDVRGRHNEYPSAAGRSRRAWKPGRCGRLQPRVPAWRRRTDPLHVRLSRDLQTEDCRSSGPVDEAGRGPCAQRDAHRTALRRSSAEPAERRAGGGDPQRRAEPRPGSDHHRPGGRCGPARRERSCGDWTGARVGRRSGRVDRGGSNRARLHPCLRVQGRHRGNAPRQPETSRRLRLQLHPRATG